MILSNLPALQVVIPLLAAPICAFMPSKRVAWLMVFAVSILCLIISLNLAYMVYIGSPISYHMGGWKPPFGIEYRVDSLNAFVVVIVSAVAAITSIYSYNSVDDEIEKNKQPLFFSLFLLCLSGLLGICMTNDAFNIYVFLEISSLATYALIAMGKDRRALIASFEYLILGTIGATFFLIGVGLLYMMTGTLNLLDLSIRIPSMLHMTPIKASLAFITVGLALKIAIFPLHLWLANSYTNAPSFVSVFLSATATKVTIYVLLRIMFSVFGYEFAFDKMHLANILATLSIAAIFIASLVAIYQNNVKRMLAYSSVAHIGYIILGLSLQNQFGNSAALVHLFNHAAAKATLFMAVGCVVFRTGSSRLDGFSGIASKMPITMAAFIVAGLSLIGVPLTGGFISKWFLLNALAQAQLWPVFVAVLVSSLLAIMYIWKVVEIAYFGECPAANKGVKEAPVLMVFPMVLMAFSILVFGIYTEPVVDYVQKISQYLFSL
jgi:multicomponent Na+:H+ antiporter subunit D